MRTDAKLVMTMLPKSESATTVIGKPWTSGIYTLYKVDLLILTRRSLPFGKDVDIGLGIAVKTYLDNYAHPGSSSDEKYVAQASYVREQLPHSVDFPGDLEITFNFFNALYGGVNTLEGEIPEGDLAVWTGAHKYLADRR